MYAHHAPESPATLLLPQPRANAPQRPRAARHQAFALVCALLGLSLPALAEEAATPIQSPSPSLLLPDALPTTAQDTTAPAPASLAPESSAEKLAPAENLPAEEKMPPALSADPSATRALTLEPSAAVGAPPSTLQPAHETPPVPAPEPVPAQEVAAAPAAVEPVHPPPPMQAAQASVAPEAPPVLNITPPLRTGRAVKGRDIPAFQRADATLILDGKLDEALWQEAPEISTFTRYLPVEGGPSASRVSLSVATSKDALLVGARVYQAPGSVRAHLAGREQISVDDRLELILDPSRSQRTGFSFTVNPYGIQWDATLQATSTYPEWDGQWDSAGQVYSDGYSIEMRIPFSTLRLSGDATQSWGIGFSLFGAAGQTTDVWPEATGSRGHRLLQLGILRDVVRPEKSLKAELVPSLVTHFDGLTESVGETRSLLTSANLEGQSQLGGDLKLVLRNGSRVNLTVNPDFSQLEADAGQLNYNLRAPLSLTEKRIFFLEGRELLEQPFPLVYTRAINQPILGARWTGKQGNVTSSVLSVLDRAPVASMIYMDPALEAQSPSPQTGFEDPGDASALTSLGRVVIDQGNGGSVGVLLADKRLLDPLTLESRAANQVVSMDAMLTLAEQYTAKAQLGYSNTSATGQSALEGSTVGLSLERSGERSYLGLDMLFHSKGFRAETSSLWRTGDFSIMGAGNVRFAPAIPGLTELKPAIQAEILPASAEGKPLEYDVREALHTRIWGHTDMGVQALQLREFFNGATFDQARISSWFSSGPQKWVYLYGNMWIGDQINYDEEDTFLGTNLNATTGLTVRPGSQWALGLSYSKGSFWQNLEDSPLYSMDIVRVKATYTATSTLVFRWITELNTGSQSLVSNALLSWTYRPGTALYFGITEREFLQSEDPRTLEAFLKVSYLFDAPLRSGSL